MQGLSKKQHEQLVDALFRLEHLLKERDADAKIMLQAENYRLELEKIMESYEQLIGKLAILIGDYQDLYSKAKVKFLGVQLKELKKEIPEHLFIYTLLQKNIQQAYGT